MNEIESEIQELQKKSQQRLWLDDLDEFENEYERYLTADERDYH